MAKTKWTTEDELLMKVRGLLKSTEPRPEPINPHENQYGTRLVSCPVCGTSVRKVVYKGHWSYYHGTKFWKEKALIKLILEATK
jgi:hypothetical protein